MGHQCCSRQKVKRGLWSPEEDEKLMRCIATHGHGCWSSVPKLAGLERCGKSCRLRWINYLRPDLKRGSFSAEEERIIIDVHRILGNRWAQIAKHLPGRTDNEVKNFWNSCIKKKLIAHGLDPTTHNLISSHQASSKSNACSLSRVFQQPTSVFTVNSQIKDASMDVNPPFVTLPLPPPHPDISSGHPLPYHEAMTMPTFENQQHNLVWTTVENQNSNCTSVDFGNGSSRKSTPISSSSINSSGFGFLDENCMWNTGVEGFEILIEEEINQQQMAQKQKTCEMEFDKINGVKEGEDLETSFNSLKFDLEFMESTFMPCEIYGNAGLMDQLEWDF